MKKQPRYLVIASDKLKNEVGELLPGTERAKWMLHFQTMKQTISIAYGFMNWEKLLKLAIRQADRLGNIIKIIVE